MGLPPWLWKPPLNGPVEIAAIRATEGGVGGDGFQPVVVEVEEHHFRLGRLQDQILSFFRHIETG